MSIQLPRIMDSNLNEIARVRPVKLAYKLTSAPISTATLTILRKDAAVTVGMYVELYNARGSIGYYRVTKVSDTYKGAPQSVISLEHAITTLSDDIIVGYQEYGGTGVNLSSVLSTLLAKQTVVRWQKGTVGFATQYQYSSENDNLLAVILSTATPLVDDYLWTYDFTTTPWTLNLIPAPTDNVCEMRLSRNVDSVKVEIDRSNQCTRLYALGYGEGVNQLTIADVNGGVKYVQDTAAQATWGIITSVFVDTSITDAAMLKAAAEAQLAIRSNPVITVTATAHDLYELTGEPLDAFEVGRLCRLVLPDNDIAMSARVISVDIKDASESTTKASITLANAGVDVSRLLAALSRKSAINELYSQGATNQYAMHFADNADASNPAELSFYVDPAAVQINSVMYRYKLEAFRGYSKGAAAGSGSPTTSSSGGGGTQTSGGGGSQGSSYVTDLATSGTPIEPSSTDDNLYTDYGGAAGGNHRHFYSHRHRTSVGITVPSIPSHTHSVTIPSHTHTVDIANHTHDPVLGIYKGSTPGTATVKVDGTTVPSGAITNGEFDAVPYLAKTAEGKITRGAWHTITVTPSGNARVVASLHVKTFVRSISGGNY